MTYWLTGSACSGQQKVLSWFCVHHRQFGLFAELLAISTLTHTKIKQKRSLSHTHTTCRLSAVCKVLPFSHGSHLLICLAMLQITSKAILCPPRKLSPFLQLMPSDNARHLIAVWLFPNEQREKKPEALVVSSLGSSTCTERKFSSCFLHNSHLPRF